MLKLKKLSENLDDVATAVFGNYGTATAPIVLLVVYSPFLPSHMFVIVGSTISYITK